MGTSSRNRGTTGAGCKAFLLLAFVAYSFTAAVSSQAFQNHGVVSTPGTISIEQLNLSELEPAIRDQISQAYTLTQRRPDDSAAIGRLGMIFQVYGKYEAARMCFRSARTLDSRSFRWAYYLGNIEGVLGEHAQAVIAIRDALKMDVSYEPARVRLAGLIFDSGDTEESMRLYREVIDHAPRMVSAHFGLGQVLSARGQLAEAAASYQRACELADTYPAAHYALAMLYRKMGDIENARAHLSLYLQQKDRKQPSFDPLMDEVQALYSGGLTSLARGSSLLQAGKLKEAIGEFESALNQNPQLSAAHVNLIALYGRMRDTAKAQEHFRIATALDPGSVEAYYNFGILLRDDNRTKDAVEIFTKVLNLNPSHPDAHVQLALLLEKAGQSEQAAKHYDLALQTNPDDRQAHFLYAENLARNGQLEAAIEHLYQTISVEDERTPICMYALAIVYDRTGNRDRALHYMRQALDRAVSLDLRDLVSTIRGNLTRLSAEASGR